MCILAKAGAWADYIGFIMSKSGLHKLLKIVEVYVSMILYPKDVIMNIGGVGDFH
jgi:hypothetical protein